jgi:hypothetical protein
MLLTFFQYPVLYEYLNTFYTNLLNLHILEAFVFRGIVASPQKKAYCVKYIKAVQLDFLSVP